MRTILLALGYQIDDFFLALVPFFLSHFVMIFKKIVIYEMEEVFDIIEMNFFSIMLNIIRIISILNFILFSSQ